MGARKFAITNLGLLGCVPALRALDPAGACVDGLNQLAAGFNDALRSLLAGLAPRLPGLVYSLADSYGLSRDTFVDPQASGYTDIAGACCGSGRLLAEGNCLPDSSGIATTLPSGPLFSRPRHSTTGRPSTPHQSTSCNWPSPVNTCMTCCLVQ